MERIARRRTFSGTYASKLERGDSLIFRRLPLSEQKRLWPVILRERWQAGRSRAIAKRSLTICNRELASHLGKASDVDRLLDDHDVFPFKNRLQTRLHNFIVSKDNKQELPRNDSNKGRMPNAKPVQRNELIKRKSSRQRAARVELELAIENDEHAKIVSAIDSNTANLNETDNCGKTLLHSACSVGNYRCAQILIDAGALVNVKDQSGFTPLHCAVVSSHVPCAAILIASGADITACTNTMHTVLTLSYGEEMILLIGRTLLLRDTLMTSVGDYRKNLELLELSLKETSL